MFIQRKIAQVIWGGNGGKTNEFEKFWPMPDEIKTDAVVKTWGTKDEADLLRKQIENAHGIKLTHE